MLCFESDLAEQADQMSVILFSVITLASVIVLSLCHCTTQDLTVEFISLTFPTLQVSLTLHSFSPSPPYLLHWLFPLPYPPILSSLFFNSLLILCLPTAPLTCLNFFQI